LAVCGSSGACAPCAFAPGGPIDFLLRPRAKAALKARLNGGPDQDLDMQDITEILLFAALGVAFAAGLAVVARWARQNPIRIGAYALIAVSFVYVGFALRSENPNSWTAVEMTGVALYGSLAMLSFFGSPWFAVLGLALHPVWAIAFHYVGSGAAFTPAPFALADAGFTGAFALYGVFLLLSAGAKPEQTPANANRKPPKGRAK